MVNMTLGLVHHSLTGEMKKGTERDLISVFRIISQRFDLHGGRKQVRNGTYSQSLGLFHHGLTCRGDENRYGTGPTLSA